MSEATGKSGLHATTLRLRGRGVIILGRSGAGKTELALTLIERAGLHGHDAALVADDRTLLRARDGALEAAVPPTLAGGVEIRGAGLFRIPFVEKTRLDLVVMLVEPSQAERYPGGGGWRFEGVEIPRLLLPALSSSGDSTALARAVEAFLFGERWSPPEA